MEVWVGVGSVAVMVAITWVGVTVAKWATAGVAVGASSKLMGKQPVP
jgi:hypothetical protein